MRPETVSPALPDEFNLEASLCHLLYRARQYAERRLARPLGSSGLTPRQFVVLTAIQQDEGLTQTDLAHKTGIDSSTLAEMITRLLARGLVVRRRLKRDGRLTSVRLSAAGRRLLDTVIPAAEAVERDLAAHIPRHNLDQLLQILKQLSDSLLREELQDSPVVQKDVSALARDEYRL